LPLSTIYQSVEEDLAKVEARLRSVSKTEFPWLEELLGYSLKERGKRIRPALTLLSGKFYNYDLNSLLPIATAVELMHTATLVHDDAIDKSMVRRGRATVNKLWGEDKAVLLGDYLFAKAGEFAADTQNMRVIKRFAQTLEIISVGELNQIFSAFNLEQTYQHYLQRISRKTASLFTIATESGAILSQAPEKSIKALADYGHNLGIAFQIVDDILDYTSTEEEMGKPIGSDLAQGTLTLPGMLLLQHYPEDNPVKRIFQNRDKLGDRDKQKIIKQALELVRNSSVVQECYQVASDYCIQARQNLDLLPENASRRALMELASFIIERRR